MPGQRRQLCRLGGIVQRSYVEVLASSRTALRTEDEGGVSCPTMDEGAEERWMSSPMEEGRRRVMRGRCGNEVRFIPCFRESKATHARSTLARQARARRTAHPQN